MGRFILLLAVLVSFTGCQQSAKSGISSEEGSDIVNGQTAAQKDVAPQGLAESVVMIVTEYEGGKAQALCTGTLIDPRIVITAGHCVNDGAKPSDITVILHMLDVAQAGGSSAPAGITGYHVQALTIHPDFLHQSLSAEDLALLLLDAPVPAGTRIARLPELNTNLATIPSLLAIGYGVADDRHSTSPQKDGSGVLRYTAFPNEKFDILPAVAQVPIGRQGMLVMEADTTSLCNGDSGGPIMGMTNGQSTNILLGVNESVMPEYKGQEQTDYIAAQKAKTVAAFYQTYPDASTCSGGLNLAVNVAQRLPWIVATKTALLTSP